MELKEAAQKLGVHYQTAYRWIRAGQLKAYKVGNTYQVTSEDLLDCLSKRNCPIAPPSGIKVRNWEHQASRLMEYLLSGNEAGARALILKFAEGGAEIIAASENLISPVFRELGEMWSTGKITIASEHRATAICERALACMMQNLRGRPRGIAVIGTPPGDQHSLPTSMATAALRSQRWLVHHIGTQVPPEDFIFIAKEVAATLIVVTLTHTPALDQANQIETLAKTQGIRSLVGAPGMTIRTLVELANARPIVDNSIAAIP